MKQLGPYGGQSPEPLTHEVERFHKKYQTVPWSGCWIWVSTIGAGGYGVMSLKLPTRKPYRAHRISYVIHHGPIDPNMVIDHTCRVKSCVNPSHLRMITQRENIRNTKCSSELNKAKKNCPKCAGEYSTNSMGWRYCRKCASVLAKKRRTEARLQKKNQNAT